MSRILIADDNAGDRQLTCLALEAVPGLEIETADHGLDALRKIEEKRPDLVVTDLCMPGMDGLELVGRLHDTDPTLPIILTTSFGSEQTAVQALAAGAASYVSKSTLRQTLPDTVRKLLRLFEGLADRQILMPYLQERRTQFALENDPALVPPVISVLKQNLERMHFGEEADRTQVGMALQEALDNALYHGNLEVESDLRDQSFNDYYALAAERREQEPYASRRVHLTVVETPEQTTYVIRDEGPGFDPGALPDPTAPESFERVCGRGLLLIQTFMDEVSHNPAGNEITLVKHATAEA